MSRMHQGATLAQARAALKQCKDVMQAAEQFFEGKFDNIMDDNDGADAQAARVSPPRVRIS